MRKCDNSIVYWQSPINTILLVVYVDGIVITRNNYARISSLKYFLRTIFHTKDLGQLKYFLRIESNRNKKRIFLFQRNYILDLLEDTGKLAAKPCNTPMITNVHLVKNGGNPFDDPEWYKRYVGKLKYLTLTRSYIAFAVSVVRQFMPAPTIKY